MDNFVESMFMLNIIFLIIQISDIMEITMKFESESFTSFKTEASVPHGPLLQLRTQWIHEPSS